MWLSRAQVQAETRTVPRHALGSSPLSQAGAPSTTNRVIAPPWGDVLGLAWVVLALAAYLSPALWDGFSFGPTDIANQLSFLTYVPHLAVHNGMNGDIITQAVPWNALDWVAAHHAQLPLWNTYSGDGMPLFLNFESSPFALPTLVGYLFPLASSFLVGIAISLLVAGTGTYTAARLAGVGPIGAALAGTTFMLSGSLSGWAGWAVSGPLTWAGWLLAGALLCCQPGRRRWAGVAVVSLSSGFAVYEGMPESLLLVGIALGTVVLVCGVLAVSRGKLDARSPLCLLAGVAGGAALSAPLWLPGLSVLRQSSRAAENGTGGLPARALALLFAQGYDGLPTKGGSWFGPADYYEATGYIGVVALVLALLAVLVAWRRPIVTALTATGLVSLCVVYVSPSQRLFTRLGAGSIATQRMLPMLGFAVAMLAGVGTEILQRRGREPRVQSRALASVVVCGAVLGYLLVSASANGLSPAELSVRRHALFWPAVTLLGMAALLAVAARASVRQRGSSFALATAAGPIGSGPIGSGPIGPGPIGSGPIGSAPIASGPTEPGPVTSEQDGPAPQPGRRTTKPTRATFWTAGTACLLLLAAQTAYLVWAGVGMNSFASRPFPASPAVARLQRLVGNNLVALDGTNKHDVTLWTGDGIYPEVNIGYGVRELAIHDPVIPPAYYRTWPSQTATLNAGLGNNFFVPAVGSATRARYYGAAFILAAPGSVPKDTQFVTRFSVPLAGSLSLYRVTGADQFTFAPGSGAQVVSSTQTSDSSWRLDVHVPRSSALTLRLTYFSGWHVTANGQTLPVTETGGLFVGATIPAGTHTITVNYWPAGLTAGFALALTAMALLLIGSVLVLAWPDRSRSIFSLTTREEPPGGMLTP